MSSSRTPLELSALEALAGAVLLVDARHRVVAVTPEARSRLGLGDLRPDVPLAEVLQLPEDGVEALLSPARADGAGAPRVRVLALGEGARPGGWAVVLAPEESSSSASEAEETFHGMWTRSGAPNWLAAGLP